RVPLVRARAARPRRGAGAAGAAGRDRRVARRHRRRLRRRQRARRGGRVSPRANAAERLQRMLAVVPWVIAHPGVRLAEVAGRFGIPERELERDLEVLPLCGLPPYTPDTLIEVD